jgi:N-acetylneuraminate synthase
LKEGILKTFNIGTRAIGPEEPPLVVAEIGINHGGELAVAFAMVDAALEAGAEIIKHQTHIPDSEMSLEARNIKPGNADISIYEVISNNSLSLSDEIKLCEYVRGKGVQYFSTPFSFDAVDFLETLNPPIYKIGSGECNNYPFVEYIASKGRPIILSTGMNSIASITPSVEIFRRHKLPFALLHCTNLYPTPDNLIRLNAITELEREFPDAILGLSDHSLTNYPCFGAVALGASVLERHFTDSKNRPGPDISCSMDPFELKELIKGSKTIHETLRGQKRPLEEEAVTIAFAFASVVAQRDISKGEVLTREMITLKRPNGGDFGPSDFKNVIGREVATNIPTNTQISRNQLK